MKLEWVILAEGLGTDSKSAVTVIGLGQNIIVAPDLPATAKRAVLAHFIEDGSEGEKSVKPGDRLNFRISAVNPSGKVDSAVNTPAIFNQPIWPGLPQVVDLPAEMILTLSEYGEYNIKVEADLPSGETIAGGVKFYVRKEPAQSPKDAQQGATSL